MKNYPSEHNSLGTIKYNEDVIRTMVNMALSDVEGIGEIEGRSSGKILSRKHNSNINKISIEGKDAVIELSITADYGLLLRDTAQNVQQKIKEIIESMTDLNVRAVNVTITGLNLLD